MLREFMYEGKIVEFFFSDQIMINATEMAAIFGKRPSKFLELQSTQVWIKWLEKTPIRAKRYPSGGQRFAGNPVLPGEIRYRSPDLVPILISQAGGGEGGVTWMHQYLAIDFAMWLDVEFKGWVILKIAELLQNYSLEKGSILMHTRQLKQELAEIEEKKSNDPIIKRIFEIRNELNQANGDLFNLNKEFKHDLFTQN